MSSRVFQLAKVNENFVDADPHGNYLWSRESTPHKLVDVANSVSTTGDGQLYFQAQTSSRPIILGGNDASGSLVLTDSDLAAIASGFSLIAIGSPGDTGAITTADNQFFNADTAIQNGTGGIALTERLNTGTDTLTLTTAGGITQTAGRITAGTLDANAATGIALSVGNAVNTFIADNTTSGLISLINAAPTLRIAALTQTGTTAGSNVVVSNAGDLIASNPVTAGDGGISLTASGDETINDPVTASTGTITMSAGVSLTINAAVTTNGSGGIRLTSGDGQTINANLSADGSGNVSLTANSASATGSFIGIDVAGATIESDTGSVTLQGTGGTGSAGEQFGVLIQGGAQVKTAGGSGTVTIDGTGGGSTGADNDGVDVTGTGTTVTSGGGTVALSGTGGGTGTGGFNEGIAVAGATVSSSGGSVVLSGTGGSDSGGSNAGVSLSAATVTTAGSGTVTVQGTGGTAAGNANDGVDELAESTITSGGGNVSVTGQAGGSSNSTSTGSDQGVFITGTVTSTGSGTVSVNGTGGNGGAGFDQGVFVGVGGTVTSDSNGAVAVAGAGGDSAGGGTAGTFVLNGTVTSGGSGTVSVQGNSVSATGPSNAGVFVYGSQATITSGGGALTVVGQSGTGSQNNGINVQGNGTVAAGGNGTLTVQSKGGPSCGLLTTPTYTASASEAVHATPAAVSIATLLASHYSDANALAKPGIAVIETSGAGTWQYSTNGTAWVTITSVSLSSALLLPQADKLRFVAAGDETGTADLVFTAWNGSAGTNGGRFDVSTVGGGSSFSKNDGQLAIAVTAVATAPVWLATTATLLPVLPGSTNPAGETVQQAFGPAFSGDGAQLAGIAVVGSTGTGSGTWQYALYNSSTKSVGSFENMPKLSASSALLLSAQDMIRFVPSNASFVGSVVLQVHAWDGSTGTDGSTVNLSKSTSIGGKTAFSSTVLTAKLYVNHAPT